MKEIITITKHENDNSLPVVTVFSWVYNHKNFIRESIESILMQRTNFKVEVIIHDDASNDGTKEIIVEYQEKYPHLFNNILHSENQWSQGKSVMTPLFEKPLGKYIALCHGDDCWTDPLKLQNQVDFLEANSDYGLVCGGFYSVNHLTNERKIHYHKLEALTSVKGSEITQSSLWNEWNVQTMTVLFRNELLSRTFVENYKYFCDMHLFYQIIKQQKGYYFNEIYGVQNVHENGIYSQKNYLEKQLFLFKARKDLWFRNKSDKFLQKKVFHSASELYINKKYLSSEIKRYKLLAEMILTMYDLNDFKHIIKCMLNHNDLSDKVYHW